MATPERADSGNGSDLRPGGAAPTPAVTPRQVPCPTCRRPALFDRDNPWRPFCSERCRSVDLGAWANEQYRVAAPAAPEGDDELPTAARPGA